MPNKTRGVVLIAAGGLLALIALGADAMGLGAHPAFGWKQILGTVAGAAVALAGLRELRR